MAKKKLGIFQTKASKEELDMFKTKTAKKVEEIEKRMQDIFDYDNDIKQLKNNIIELTGWLKQLQNIVDRLADRVGV